MREITDTTTVSAEVKQYVGNEPHLIVTAEGEIIVKRLKGTGKAVTTVTCPAAHTLIVGTEAEIDTEFKARKAASDAIKAQRRADQRAALVAARQK